MAGKGFQACSFSWPTSCYLKAPNRARICRLQDSKLKEPDWQLVS